MITSQHVLMDKTYKGSEPFLDVSVGSVLVVVVYVVVVVSVVVVALLEYSKGKS